MNPERRELFGRSTARVKRIQRHLTSSASRSKRNAKQGRQTLNPMIRGRILEKIDELQDARRGKGGYDVSDHLPGPTNDRRYDIKTLLREIQKVDNNGSNHMYWQKMQDRYCGGDRIANFVLPVISFSRTEPPILANKIVLSHPDDCSRIARTHVQKMPDQTIFLHTGVLSQIDNERWRRQRGHLNEAFLPDLSLRRLVPLSVRRANQSTRDLLAKVGPKGNVVQLNEFLLNETMAQLLLLLFGMPESVVKKYNGRVRDAFSYLLEVTGGTGGGAAEEMDLTKVQRSAAEIFMFASKVLKNAPQAIGVSELSRTSKEGDDVHDTVRSVAATTTKPLLKGWRGTDGIVGPLSARINDIETGSTNSRRETMEERIFNAATFVFAGHDTTANTMTWLLFEVSQRPEIQRRLHREVDAVASRLTSEGRALCYDDLRMFEYMTKCIAETLRLWPVVPNGTFRQLQFDDTVCGPGPAYKPVHVPKGTFVQIANWTRHRSKQLWGPDAETFNPDRAWKEDELWGDSHFPLGGFNPASERYSPFTYAPRDCMGKNFAHMEMRVILYTLFRHFSFDLAPPTSAYDSKTFMGVNRATLGPQDNGVDPSLPPTTGLYMRMTPRSQY